MDSDTPQDQSPLEIPNVQKAWQVVARGSPTKALKLVTDAPVPSKLGKGEVLVKVQAAALNPVAYKVMQLAPGFVVKKPYVPEFDLAGIIVDANDSNFTKGDIVYGMFTLGMNFKTRLGTLCQYTRLPADYVTLKPPHLSITDVAGITLVSMTAYQALFHVAHLEPGQAILVNGGSSTVGAFAIQFAKAKGCKVTATASGKNEEFVRGLGADEFFDYTKAPLHSQLTENPPSPKFNVIFDAVGLLDPSLYTHSPAYLVSDGIYVTVGPQPKGFNVKEMKTAARMAWEIYLKPRWLGGTKRKWTIVSVGQNKEDLDTIAQMVREGTIKPVVDSVYPFDDALKAYERLRTGRAKGKVVITVDDALAT